MNTALVEAIRKHFAANLQEKTGWGRNDVMVAFDRAVTKALLEALDAQ